MGGSGGSSPESLEHVSRPGGDDKEDNDQDRTHDDDRDAGQEHDDDQD